MAELSKSEQLLLDQGVYGYFLGKPPNEPVVVTKHIQEIALPKLDELIAGSDEPIFDYISREALQLAVRETPPDTKMSWHQFCRYFDIAIHGPDRFSEGLQNPKETPETIAAFSDQLKAFRNEYANM